MELFRRAWDGLKIFAGLPSGVPMIGAGEPPLKESRSSREGVRRVVGIGRGVLTVGSVWWCFC